MPSDEGLEERLRSIAQRNAELGKAIGFVGAKANRIADELTQKLDQVRGELGSEIELAVRRAVSGIPVGAAASNGAAQAAEAKPEFVSQVIQAAEQAAQRVAKLPSGRVRPERLQSCKLQIERSRDDLRRGLTQAALALAQDAFAGLSVLEVEILALQASWDAARTSALQKIVKLCESLDAQKSVAAHDENGQALEQTLDVDFWTRGEWAQLRGNAETNRRFLASPSADTDAALFARIETEFVPAAENSLRELVERTRRSALRSQQRLNIMQQAIQTLVDRGFEFRGEQLYENNDFRGPLFARLWGPSDGELIVALQPPEFTKTELNSIEIHSFSADPQYILVARRDELGDALSNQGLPVYNYTGFTNKPREGVRELFAADST
jgi:hypothetical protein